MGISPEYVALRHWIPCVVLGVLAVSGSAWAQDSQKKVLVLYSTGRDAALSLTGERELPRVLGDSLSGRLDYYAEYIDGGRFPDKTYCEGFRDFLRVKYGAMRLDLVIAMLDVAIEFLATYREELFRETPVVFFARDGTARRLPNSTGTTAEVGFGETLGLAMALQPDIEQVFVVSGAASRDRAWESRARAQLQHFEPRVRFTYLSGLPTKELEQRLASLPDRSIVYYLLVYQDGDGESVQPLDYLRRIARSANRPIYSWVDSTLDRGVVGGSLQTVESQVATTANLALRVLRGEPADSIAVAATHFSMNQVDWRQLRRWGISESRVPPGTVVRFREPGTWELYRGYFLAGGVILGAQSALIVGLLVQAARRRQAEQQLLRSQTELRESSERIRDLSRRLLHAQEDERTRIARELHDDLGLQMTLLTLDLERLSDPARHPDDDRNALVVNALERSHLVARNVHEMSHRLHPAKLQLLGLVAALRALQRELVHANVAATFSDKNVPARLPQNVTVCLFRVAEEALRNVVKHSGARRTSVRLAGGPAALTLTVADDGVGFDVGAGWNKGIGLASMNERLLAIGGTFKIESQPGVGTRIEVSVPISAGNDQRATPVAVSDTESQGKFADQDALGVSDA